MCGLRNRKSDGIGALTLTRADTAAQAAEDADEGGDEDHDKQGGQGLASKRSL